MINFVLVFIRQTLDRWVYSVFLMYICLFLTVENYYVLNYFSYRTEDGLSLMDAHCSSLWFQENSPIVFCTYLLELLSKKGRGRRGIKKEKQWQQLKRALLLWNTGWLLMGFILHLLVLWFGGQVTFYLGSLLVFFLSFSPATASCKC